VLKTLVRKLDVMDASALEEGYQEILTGLDCKPYPSLEGMKNIQRLAKWNQHHRQRKFFHGSSCPDRILLLGNASLSLNSP
jgi:hypothetical protein